MRIDKRNDKIRDRKIIQDNATGRDKRGDIARESYFQTVMRRFRRHHLAAVSLVVLVILVGAALLAPLIAPYDPDAIVGPFSGPPSAQFWLGTDQIGRDVFSLSLIHI